MTTVLPGKKKKEAAAIARDSSLRSAAFGMTTVLPGKKKSGAAESTLQMPSVNRRALLQRAKPRHPEGATRLRELKQIRNTNFNKKKQNLYEKNYELRITGCRKHTANLLTLNS